MCLDVRNTGPQVPVSTIDPWIHGFRRAYCRCLSKGSGWFIKLHTSWTLQSACTWMRFIPTGAFLKQEWGLLLFETEAVESMYTHLCGFCQDLTAEDHRLLISTKKALTSFSLSGWLKLNQKSLEGTVTYNMYRIHWWLRWAFNRKSSFYPKHEWRGAGTRINALETHR